MNRAVIFDKLRAMFGGRLSQRQVDGIKAILAAAVALPAAFKQGVNPGNRQTRTAGGKVTAHWKPAIGGTGAAVALAAAIIAPWEGRELRAYRDIVGVWTICYGETRGVRPGQTATPAQCEAMLAKAVGEYEVAIRPCLPATMPDQTRAAFVSAAYNIGPAAFCGSSMSRRAKAGDLRGACDALLLWNKAGGRVVKGLSNRRAAERALCLEGLR